MSISYIIVCRNPRSKKLVVVHDGEEHPAEFDSEDAAYAAAANTTICRAWGAEIVPVDRPSPPSQTREK